MDEFKDYLEERSEIMSVFTETERRLQAQNEQIEAEQDKINDELVKLSNRSQDIGIISKKNKGVLTRIKKIIG